MVIVIDIPQVTDVCEMTDACIVILDDHNYGNRRQQAYQTDKSRSSIANILIFLVVIAIVGCCICAGGLFFCLVKRRRSDGGFNRVPTTETTTAQETTKAVGIPIKETNTAQETTKAVSIPIKETNTAQKRQRLLVYLSKETETNDANLFRSGVWSGRYYFQYDQWNGPSNFSLSFDPELIYDSRARIGWCRWFQFNWSLFHDNWRNWAREKIFNVEQVMKAKISAPCYYRSYLEQRQTVILR